MLCLFFLCLFVQIKTDSIFADYDKPLYQSCRLAERIQGSNILSLPWNASNYRNGVISLNRVKEPYTPLRLKSYQEYNEILWIRLVLKGIGVVVSLTTQAAALITFGKFGLRKYQASQAGSGPGWSVKAKTLEESNQESQSAKENCVFPITDYHEKDKKIFACNDSWMALKDYPFLGKNCAFMFGPANDDYQDSEFPPQDQAEDVAFYQDSWPPEVDGGQEQYNTESEEVFYGRGRQTRNQGQRNVSVRHAVIWPTSGVTKQPPSFQAGCTWRKIKESIELWMDGCEVPASRILPLIFATSFQAHQQLGGMARLFKQLHPDMMKLTPKSLDKGGGKGGGWDWGPGWDGGGPDDYPDYKGYPPPWGTKGGKEPFGEQDGEEKPAAATDPARAGPEVKAEKGTAGSPDAASPESGKDGKSDGSWFRVHATDELNRREAKKLKDQEREKKKKEKRDERMEQARLRKQLAGGGGSDPETPESSSSSSSTDSDDERPGLRDGIEKIPVTAFDVEVGKTANERFPSWMFFKAFVDDRLKDTQPIIMTHRFQAFQNYSRPLGMNYLAFIDEWERRRQIILDDGLCNHLLGTRPNQAMSLFHKLQLDKELYLRFMRDLKLGTKKHMEKLTVQKIRDKLHQEVTLPSLASQRSNNHNPAGAMMAGAVPYPSHGSTYAVAPQGFPVSPGFPTPSFGYHQNEVVGETDDYDSGDDWDDRPEYEDMQDESCGFLVDGIEDYSRQHERMLPTFFCVSACCLLALDEHGFLAKNQCAKCGDIGHWWKDCPNQEKRFPGKPKAGLKKKPFRAGPQVQPKAHWMADDFEDTYPQIEKYQSAEDYDGAILFQKGKKGRKKGSMRKGKRKGKSGAFALNEVEAACFFRRKGKSKGKGKNGRRPFGSFNRGPGKGKGKGPRFGKGKAHFQDQATAAPAYSPPGAPTGGGANSWTAAYTWDDSWAGGYSSTQGSYYNADGGFATEAGFTVIPPALNWGSEPVPPPDAPPGEQPDDPNAPLAGMYVDQPFLHPGAYGATTGSHPVDTSWFPQNTGWMMGQTNRRSTDQDSEEETEQAQEHVSTRIEVEPRPIRIGLLVDSPTGESEDKDYESASSEADDADWGGFRPSQESHPLLLADNQVAGDDDFRHTIRAFHRGGLTVVTDFDEVQRMSGAIVGTLNDNGAYFQMDDVIQYGQTVTWETQARICSIGGNEVLATVLRGQGRIRYRDDNFLDNSRSMSTQEISLAYRSSEAGRQGITFFVIGSTYGSKVDIRLTGGDGFSLLRVFGNDSGLLYEKLISTEPDPVTGNEPRWLLELREKVVRESTLGRPGASAFPAVQPPPVPQPDAEGGQERRSATPSPSRGPTRSQGLRRGFLNAVSTEDSAADRLTRAPAPEVTPESSPQAYRGPVIDGPFEDLSGRDQYTVARMIAQETGFTTRAVRPDGSIDFDRIEEAGPAMREETMTAARTGNVDHLHGISEAPIVAGLSVRTTTPEQFSELTPEEQYATLYIERQEHVIQQTQIAAVRTSLREGQDVIDALTADNAESQKEITKQEAAIAKLAAERAELAEKAQASEAEQRRLVQERRRLLHEQRTERVQLIGRQGQIEARLAARMRHEGELTQAERLTQHRNSLAFWNSLPRSHFAYCHSCASTSLYDEDESQIDPAGNFRCRNPFCSLHTEEYSVESRTVLGAALRLFERDNAGVAQKEIDVPALVKVGIVIQDPTANNEVLMVESCSIISASGTAMTRNAETPLYWWTFPWTRVSDRDLDRAQVFPAIQRLLMHTFGFNSDWMFVEGPNSWTPRDYAVCTPPGITPTLFTLVQVPGWKRIMEQMRSEWWDVRNDASVAKYRNYRWFSASFPFEENAHFSKVGIQVIKDLLKVPLRFIARPLADHAQQLQYAPGLSQLEVYWIGSLLETCRRVDNDDFDTFYKLVMSSALLVSKERKHKEPRNPSVFSFKLLECGSQSSTDPLLPAYQRRIREAIILPTAGRIEAGPLFGLGWMFGRLSMPSNLWIRTLGRGPPERNFLSHADCSWAWRAPGLSQRRAPRSSIEFLKFEEQCDSEKFSFSVVMNYIYDVFQGRILEDDTRIDTSPVHSPESVSNIGREEARIESVWREVERQTEEHAYHQSRPMCSVCGEKTHWARDCPNPAVAQRQPESRNSGEPPSDAIPPSQGPGRTKKKKKKQTSQ